MTEQFEEVITTRERLREFYRMPSHGSSKKVIDHIDDICRPIHRGIHIRDGSYTRRGRPTGYFTEG